MVKLPTGRSGPCFAITSRYWTTDGSSEFASLRTELRDAERRLDNEKTDRVDLGNHFLEIGRRLSGEVVSLPTESCVERPRKVKSDAKA